MPTFQAPRPADGDTPDVPRGTRAAWLLVRLFPPARRARYGPEMLALLAAAGVDVRGAASLLRAAATAWLRPAGHLAEPPPGCAGGWSSAGRHGPCSRPPPSPSGR